MLSEERDPFCHRVEDACEQPDLLGSYEVENVPRRRHHVLDRLVQVELVRELAQANERGIGLLVQGALCDLDHLLQEDERGILLTLEDLGLRAGVSAALGGHGTDDSLLDDVVLRVADDEQNRRQLVNGLGEPQGELDGTYDAAAGADVVAHRADHLQLARGSVKHLAC